MEYLKTKLQYYPASVYETIPLGTCTLSAMLEAIKNPRSNILELFKKIEQASQEGNKKLKDQLKSKLYYFSPCVFTDGKGRKYENIINFTGLLILDFDNLTEEIAKELKQFLFDEYPFVIASFLSSSKKGVKVLVRIPIVNSIEDFKSLFYGLAVKMQWIKGFDGSSQNCMLPNYLTYDYDILIREDAIEFTGLGYKVDEFKTKEIGEVIPLENVTEEDKEDILKQIRNMFKNITDNGHIPVRSASLLLGGFQSAGYFTEEEVEAILFDLVDETPYLQAKPNVYKRTVKEMLNRGKLAPLYLDKHEK